jgi:hypothetical protein
VSETDSAGAFPAGVRKGFEALLRPPVVFAAVCLLYLLFPLNWFNADALHYNLIAHVSAQDPTALLRDVVVPVHLLWHALSTAVLWMMRPDTPEQSLYILRALNIVTALASIGLFIKLVRSDADDRATAWAAVMLAFSYACLMSFLSLEVYALNNLVLMLLLMLVRSLTRAPSPPNARQTVLLAVLTALALGAHLTNVLLIIPLLLVLLRGSRWDGLRRSLLFAATLGGIGLVVVVVLALASGRPAGSIASFLVSHRIGTEAYLSANWLANAKTSVATLGAAIAGRHGLWLLAPWAVVFIACVSPRWTMLARDPWLRYLGVHLIVFGAFFSQWDPSNVEHKIALIPLLLLIAVQLYVHADQRLPRLAAVGAATLAGGILAVGAAQAIYPHRDLEDYHSFRMASAVHARSDAPSLLVVTAWSPQESDALSLAAMTFFGQRVVLIGRDDPLLEQSIASHRAAGFELIGPTRSAHKP